MITSETTKKNIQKIYRYLHPFMNFDDMYNENYIVYDENNTIYIKYNTKSKNTNTSGTTMCGGVKIFTFDELLEKIDKK